MKTFLKVKIKLNFGNDGGIKNESTGTFRLK
ncbi:hypothetical protein BACCIP111883_00147 [Sutcliffiella rhizosphaerae]|uniref:Uncharacterized protein n=1 Tax=Sutcliffiella rhizosphaerae TaxID=2880967 RepID=A0ABN8A2Q7_9BACI|nr:hypothetical protein BACCIP111883_00147 [Sutcliffiella rhizosphaerae]